MKICLFLILMSIFIGASYSTARRGNKAQSGSVPSGGTRAPRG